MKYGQNVNNFILNALYQTYKMYPKNSDFEIAHFKIIGFYDFMILE